LASRPTRSGFSLPSKTGHNCWSVYIEMHKPRIGLPIRRSLLSPASLKCSIDASPAIRRTEAGRDSCQAGNLGSPVTGFEQDFDFLAL
jgi:hypothetical protein